MNKILPTNCFVVCKEILQKWKLCKKFIPFTYTSKKKSEENEREKKFSMASTCQRGGCDRYNNMLKHP